MSLHLGDCLEVLKEFEDGSFTACVTDPPYELGFMGKEWDRSGVTYQVETWTEIKRVLKPGGMLLAFGGTRTHHRLACAIEDAGFEIRDTLMWLYGSGFPKSLDISKAIDRAAGIWRGRCGVVTILEQPCKGTEYKRNPKEPPATESAKRWNGWGTALKPAWESILFAMKPLDGTFAQNALEHGVAGINVDGGRIGTEKRINQPMGTPENCYGGYAATATATVGRWPANVALDEEAAEMLDTQSGERSSGGQTMPPSAGASRFFYTAKAHDKDRNLGHNKLVSKNRHPTVKPVNLMRWLVRLVTMPEGTRILDPFMGSGSTGVACELEGVDFVGIEKEAESFATAKKRIGFGKFSRVLGSKKDKRAPKEAQS